MISETGLTLFFVSHNAILFILKVYNFPKTNDFLQNLIAIHLF